jgi:KaiC/GvpD/RAD55 family RecA-like ATPase
MAKKDLNIQPGETILFISPAEKYLKSNVSLIKKYEKNKSSYIIYVTILRPYSSLNDLLKKAKVDQKRILIIDAATPTSNQRAGNAIFVGSPKALTTISIAITSASEKLKDQEKYLFFDSMSALLTYNQLGTVARFAQFITATIRKSKLKGVIISLEKDSNPELVSQLSQICDRIVEIK